MLVSWIDTEHYRMRRYSLVCGEGRAEQIERLAMEYNLTEQEVLRQLVDAGLDTVDSDTGPGREKTRRERDRVTGPERM